MSDIARFWSRNLKGLNLAEHAICRELAEYHNENSNLCFPNINTLCEIYECSRTHMKNVLGRLDSWRLVSRVEWFDETKRQTANRYRLNLSQHFPDPIPEGRRTSDKNKDQKPRDYDARDREALAAARDGRKFLRMMHYSLPTSRRHLAAALKEGFYQKSIKTFWVTVESHSHMLELMEILPDLARQVRHEAGAEFEVSPIGLYFRLKPTKIG